MKKLYGSFAAKFLAVVLLCCMALVFVGSFCAAVAIQSWDGYTGGYQTMEKKFIANLGERLLSQVGSAYTDGQLTEERLPFYFQSCGYDDENAFWFEILDRQKNVLLSNYQGGKTLWEGWQEFAPCYSLEVRNEGAPASVSERRPTVTPTPRPADAEETEPSAEEAPVWEVRNFRDQTVLKFSSEEEFEKWIRDNTVYARGYLPDPMPGCFPESRDMRMLGVLYAWRVAFLWLIGLSLVLGILLFVFLIRAAGHRKGTDEIVPGFVDKIPFEVFTLLIIGLMALALLPLDAGWDWPEILVVLIPVTLCAGLLFLLWCLSLAVRVKLGNLWSGCLLVRFFRWLRSGLSALIRRLPILWKWIVGLAAAAFADLIFRMNAVYSENRAFFFWLLFWLLAGGGTLYGVLAFRRLRQGAREIADGNMLATVEEKNLVGDFKDHARDLNRIRDGLNGAVDQRMKSERLRTELITNVSHDIKTPLTSIVNYVDLMQKEGPENEKQREYLEVLSRQSQKLKKLIEDLIEASKASTGNLAVELQPCDLAILLDQCAGEYAERLEKAGLELVVQKPDHPVTVRADGRHLWRVFDNLLNNIVKYALPGTRVYLNLREENGRAEVTFRNISREALNSDAGELTERFVRGDASRHTEGNGLGLSIAMSLMRLQKGDMEINVDGDLFKVTLRFAAQ